MKTEEDISEESLFNVKEVVDLFPDLSDVVVCLLDVSTTPNAVPPPKSEAEAKSPPPPCGMLAPPSPSSSEVYAYLASGPELRRRILSL